MCGILGLLNPDGITEEELDYFREMLLKNQRRGTDATGMAVPGSIIKSPVRASLFIQKNWSKIAPRIIGRTSVIGHGRRASRGSPRINTNNHPIPSENWNFAMIHNGHVYSKTIPLESTETDSLMIARSLDLHWDDDLIKTANDSFKEFRGSAVIINILRDGGFLIVRRGNPLLYHNLSGSLFFAQEEVIFPKAFKGKPFTEIKNNQIAVVFTDGTVDIHELIQKAKYKPIPKVTVKDEIKAHIAKKSRRGDLRAYMKKPKPFSSDVSDRVCICDKCGESWFGFGNCPGCKNPILKDGQIIDDVFPEIEKDLLKNGFCPIIADMKSGDRTRFFAWFKERNEKVEANA